MKPERPISGALALTFVGLLVGMAGLIAWRALTDPGQIANDAILDARAARGRG